MRHGLCTLVLKMQRVSLSRRIVNISVLRAKAVLQRNVFTTAGHGKGDEFPCVTLGDREKDEKFLQPFTHILQIPGKRIIPKLCHAFNYWLKVPGDKFNLVTEISELMHNSNLLIDDMEDDSALRRSIPAAHTIYGIPSTINAVNYVHFMVLKKAQGLNHPEAIILIAELLLRLFRGQGLDIYWRDNYACPTLKEYKDMAMGKATGLFTFGMQLMQLSSDNKTDFTKLTSTLGLYYQVYNDYDNICRPEGKGYYEDLTEGKFSLPIIHAITSHPDDSQVLCILRQRTQDVDLKKYCVKLLEEFGSLSYTRCTLAELDAELRTEVAKHGGNPLLEDLLDELLVWKTWAVGSLVQ